MKMILTGDKITADEAVELGLVTDRLAATVLEVTDGPCSYSTPENPQDCRSLTLELRDGPDADARSVAAVGELQFELP